MTRRLLDPRGLGDLGLDFSALDYIAAYFKPEGHSSEGSTVQSRLVSVQLVLSEY